MEMSFRRSFFGSKKGKKRSSPKSTSKKNKNKQNGSDKKNKIDIDALETNLEISKFLLSCEQGDIATLRSILIKYDDVHVDDEEEKENHKKLQFLLNHQDANTNKTGLIYACLNGHVHIAEELIKIEQGLFLNNKIIETCYDGSTPLYHATSRGHVNVCRLLLKYGAKVNIINNKGWTPLMNAAYFGRDDMVSLLLKNKADPDIVRDGFDGKTALHFASKNGRYQVTELLLDYGADPNIADKEDGTTPLMYATQQGYQEIIHLLILYGADPTIMNTNGKQAIDFIEYSPDKTVEDDIVDVVDDILNSNLLDNVISDDENENESQHKTENKQSEKDLEEEEMKLQQKNLYSLMEESENIYDSICKLIHPKQMRLILRNMNKLHNSYPLIKQRINKCEHVSELYKIDNMELHDFKDLCINDIKKNLVELKPYNEEIEEYGDGDGNDSYQVVLDQYKSEIMETTEKCNIAKEDLVQNESDITQIEQEIIKKTKNASELMAQISLLKRQLKQCENDKRLLQEKLQQKQSETIDLNQTLGITQDKLNIDKSVYDLMARATENIKSVCDKAEKLPTKYTNDLQFIYQKKRKQLENNWKSWNLQDIIAWICGLDLSGKFKKYRKNLQKLSELEEDHEEYDSPKHKPLSAIIGHDIEGSQNDHDPSPNPHGLSLINPQELESMENDIDHMIPKLVTPSFATDTKINKTPRVDMDEIGEVLQIISPNGKGNIANDDTNDESIMIEQEHKQDIEMNHTPILELINDTVLKMCGVRDANDRKVILMNIESLRERSMYQNVEQDQDEIADQNLNVSQDHISEIDIDSLISDEGDISVGNIDEEEIAAEHEEENGIVKDDIDDEDKNEREVIVESKENESEIVKADEKEEEEQDRSPLGLKRQVSVVESKFICPLSKKIMIDPVSCSDGYSYERVEIEKWLETNDTSPITKEKLSTKQLFPNQTLKSMLDERI